MSEPSFSPSSDASSVDEVFQFSGMAGPSSDTPFPSSSPISAPPSMWPISSMPASYSPRGQSSIRPSSSIPVSSSIQAQAQSSMQPRSFIPTSSEEKGQCSMQPLPSCVQAHPSMAPGFWVPAQSSMGPPLFVPATCPKRMRPSVTSQTTNISPSAMLLSSPGLANTISLESIVPLAPRASMQRSYAKNQRLREKFVEFAGKFWPSPTQKPRPSLVMEEMCFVADFGDLVDTHTIQKSRLSGMFAAPEESPGSPMHSSQKVKWSAYNYPSSFFALCRQLWVVMLHAREFSHWLNATMYLVRDIQNDPKQQLFHHIRSNHAFLINQIHLILLGQNEGQIAYPDIQVPSPHLWSILNEVFIEHGWIMEKLLDIRELATKRRLKMDIRLQEGVTATHCRELELEIERLSHEVAQSTVKLEKMHSSFGYSFKQLTSYLLDTVCHVPTGGPLFEETNPIQPIEMFGGYAMDSQVESLDWMKAQDMEETEF